MSSIEAESTVDPLDPGAEESSNVDPELARIKALPQRTWKQDPEEPSTRMYPEGTLFFVEPCMDQPGSFDCYDEQGTRVLQHIKPRVYFQPAPEDATRAEAVQTLGKGSWRIVTPRYPAGTQFFVHPKGEGEAFDCYNDVGEREMEEVPKEEIELVTGEEEDARRLAAIQRFPQRTWRQVAERQTTQQYPDGTQFFVVPSPTSPGWFDCYDKEGKRELTVGNIDLYFYPSPAVEQLTNRVSAAVAEEVEA